MSTITIDGIEYSEDSLSTEAKVELAGMQACDQQIAAMQTKHAITQTARNAYAAALSGLLPRAAPKAKAKAKIKPAKKA